MSATELAVEATMDSVGTPIDVLVSFSTETSHHQKIFVSRQIQHEPHPQLILSKTPCMVLCRDIPWPRSFLGVTVQSSLYTQERGLFPYPAPEANIPFTVGL